MKFGNIVTAPTKEKRTPDKKTLEYIRDVVKRTGGAA